MTVIGGRLLLAAVYVWAYQLFVFVHDGDWSDTTWLDVVQFAGIDRLISHFRGIEASLLWCLGTPIGLELFFVGAVIFSIGWRAESRRKAAIV